MTVVIFVYLKIDNLLTETLGVLFSVQKKENSGINPFELRSLVIKNYPLKTGDSP